MATDPPTTAKAGFPASRRKGRVLALQVLYEVDLTGHLWREALRIWAEGSRLSQRAVTLAMQYVGGVLERRQELDELLGRFAPAWPVSQLAVVDRNILRLALYEMRFAATAPPKVVINEAVELAKAYGGDASPRFINGVLGSVLAEEEQSGGEAETTEL